MKLLIATGLYPPEIGGPATYATMLEQSLPGHQIETEVVPFGWVRGYPKVFRHFVYAFKLWQASRAADVMYALDPISVGLPAMVVAKLRGLPFMIRLGGDYAWEQGRVRFGVTDTLDDYIKDVSVYSLPVRILANIQSLVTRQASLVIVPSEYLKTIVAQWGVDETSIVVIYSALFPLMVEGSKDTLRHQLVYRQPTIVTAGRLVPWKGFRLLIILMAKLREEYPEILLVIVGDGPDRPLLESLVDKYRLREQVRFVGSVSKEALGAAIKAADVFVLNTAYEGLSHQLLEVMDLGTPVVTTTAGGNPELITHGVSGLLVPFNDDYALTEAVRYILNQPEAGARMVQSARLRTKEFTQAVVVERFVTVLREWYGEPT